MTRFYFLLAAFIFSLSLEAQETVISIQGLDTTIKQSFVVTNEANGTFAIFMDDSEHITGRLFSSDFQLLASAQTKRRPNFSKNLLGYELFDKKINLLMNSNSGRSYGVLTFDFKQQLAIDQEIDFMLSKERFIDAVMFENKIHLVCVSEKENKFNIHTLQSNLEFTHSEIVLKDDELLNRKERPVSLFSLLSKEDASGPVIDKDNINNETPNALEAGTKPLKVYKKESRLTFTSDKFNEFTHVISLDLATSGYTVARIEKHSFGGSRLGVQSNSFFKNDTLFQIVTNGKALDIRAIDLKTKTLINQHMATKKETIGFKNTPIYKAGTKEKSLNPNGDTAAFLKRMSSNDIGITVYERNGNYEITYGAIIEKEDVTAMVVGGLLFGAVGAVVSSAISNDASNSFAQYNSSNTFRTTGLFDTSLNTVEGTIEENVFDQIQRFIEPQKSKMKAPTVFNKGGDYFLGFQLKNAATYYLVQFKE